MLFRDFSVWIITNSLTFVSLKLSNTYRGICPVVVCTRLQLLKCRKWNKFNSRSHSKFSCFALSYAAERYFCTVLLKASIAPWLWGWYGDPKICLAFILIKYASKILLTNSLPLSDWRISGYPCIKTWAIAFLTVIASLFLIGIA